MHFKIKPKARSPHKYSEQKSTAVVRHMSKSTREKYTAPDMRARVNKKRTQCAADERSVDRSRVSLTCVVGIFVLGCEEAHVRIDYKALQYIIEKSCVSSRDGIDDIMTSGSAYLYYVFWRQSTAAENVSCLDLSRTQDWRVFSLFFRPVLRR